jgi:ABC-2 type transport system permease protein
LNIFRHELRSYRKQTLIWSASLALVVVLFLSLFPSFSKDVEASQKILENLPLALRQALGISLGNFFTILGFYGYLFTFVTLAGAIQAMNLGVGVISKEGSGKTADFLLTKPVGRSSIVTQKLLAALAALVFTNVIFAAVAFAAASAVSVKSFDTATFFLITGSLFLIQLAFLASGVFLSVVIPRVKSVIAVSLPVVFIFFIISSVGSIIGSGLANYVTPFKFYDTAYIIQNGRYEARFLAVEAVFVLAAVTAAYVVFNKKDVRSAA